MRALTYYVAVSLDGYIAGPQGQYDAFPMEGDHMQALLHEYTDTIPTHIARALGLKADRSRFDTVLCGWNTYEVGLRENIPSPYAHLRQVVATRNHRVDEPGIEVTTDPVATVRKLKQEDGAGLWLCGGGMLASILAAEIDRLVLKRNPVVFGAGIPLFAGPYAPRPFALENTRVFKSGVILEEFRRVA
ncbi:MAG: dihydrofolate reductase family protein [Cystobacter sp.]